MSPNVSLPILKSAKNGQTTMDTDTIMDYVTIILYSLTIVIGVTGNSMVIWVAGFKLKVPL